MVCPPVVEFAAAACPLVVVVVLEVVVAMVVVSFDSEVVRERPSVGVILWEFCFSGSRGSLHCSLPTERRFPLVKRFFARNTREPN